MAKKIKGFIQNVRIYSKTTKQIKRKDGTVYEAKRVGNRVETNYFNEKGDKISKTKFARNNGFSRKELEKVQSTYEKQPTIESWSSYKHKNKDSKLTNKEKRKAYNEYLSDKKELGKKNAKKFKKPKEKQAFYEFVNVRNVQELDVNNTFFLNGKEIDFVGLMEKINDLLAPDRVPSFYRFVLKIKVIDNKIYFKITKDFEIRSHEAYEEGETNYMDFYENEISFSTQDKKELKKIKRNDMLKLTSYYIESKDEDGKLEILAFKKIEETGELIYKFSERKKAMAFLAKEKKQLPDFSYRIAKETIEVSKGFWV